MKKSFAISIASACLLANANAYELPIEVTNAITNDSWGIQLTPALSRNELTTYFLSNWSQLLNNIEHFPTRMYDPSYKKERIISTVSTFYEDCALLEPLVYVDFLDKVLSLRESGRITPGELQLILLPDNSKSDFLSVNYEHPRVANILEKAISLVPPDDDGLKRCLEDMANGSLADNYLTNKSMDAPLPQTLPGIKLKRPWGSLIKKYEKITGTKVPPDPDFPEEPQSRPERRPHQSGLSDDSEINTARQTISPTSKSMIGAMAALSVGGLIWMWARWRKRRER
jgi:hypothetical protein